MLEVETYYIQAYQTRSFKQRDYFNKIVIGLQNFLHECIVICALKIEVLAIYLI